MNKESIQVQFCGIFLKLILTYLSYLIPINYWKRSYNKENTKQGCAETLLYVLKKARVVFV